jgi:predicted amidohydrolase
VWRITDFPRISNSPHTGEAHWEPLIRARAIENQVYMIAPAQFGPNVHGFSDYYERSFFRPLFPKTA